MAYAKHFKSRFFSADGNAYQIWLDEDGFGGSVVEVKGRSDPAVINWGRRGMDPFAPIRASKAALQLWRTDDDETELEDVLATGTNKFRVRIVQGTSQAAIEGGTHDLYWQGYLILDSYADSTVDLPDELDLEAIDGISQLKHIPYVDDSGASDVAYTGRESLLTVFVRVMDKIGHSLPFNMVSRTYADGEAKTVDPWAKITLDNTVYYDEEGQAATCYAVLKDLMYRMNCVVYQWMGEWWALDLAVVDGTAYDVYQYDSAGSATGSTTNGAAVDVDAAVAAGTVLREQGIRTFRQPIGLTQIQFNHGVIPSLIKAGDFGAGVRRGSRGSVEVGEDWEDFWTLSGSGGVDDPIVRLQYQGSQRPRGSAGRGLGQTSYFTQNNVLFIPAFFHGSSRDPDTVKTAIFNEGRTASQLGDPLATGNRIAFRGRLRIPHKEGDGDGLFMSYWYMNINGSIWSLQTDGSWEDVTGQTIPERMQFIDDPGANWGDKGLPLDVWHEFEFISDAAPAGGEIFLRLWGTSDKDGSDLDPEGVEWDDLEVRIIDEDGDIIEAAVTQVFTGEPDEARDLIEVFIGPAPLEVMDSRVEWDGTYVTDFENDLITPAVDFDRLTTEVWLRFLNRFLEQRFETYKNLTYSMGDALTIHNNTFFPVYVSKSLMHDRDEVELVLHEFDDAVSVTEAVFADQAGQFTKQTGGVQVGSSSAGGNASSNLALYLSTRNPIAHVDADYAESDVVTELTVDAVTDAGLLDEDQVVAIDKVTGKFFRFQMSADETDVTWDVEDPDNPGTGLTLDGDLASGSGIYFANDQLLALVFGNISPVTTKGDLVVANASGEEARFPIGTDGQVPIADSGEALGIRWGDLDTSPITTKGDLIAGDASGDEDRLPVSGTDRSILIEDSSEALGVAWSGVQLPSTLFSGKFNATNPAGDAKQYTVTDGWITGESDPPPVVEAIFYITDPSSGTNGDLRKLTT